MLGALVAVGPGRRASSPPGWPPAGPCGRPRRRPRPRPGGSPGVIAVLACAALAAAWMVPTLGTLAAGMDRADSLWYHMPLAARFVQTGYLGHIYFFDPIFLASFYPANSEVLHARPDPVLRPRQRLARAQPGLAVDGPARRLVHRPAVRARAAGADRRLGGARLAEPGRVPGRRGAQRHHGRRLRPRRRRAAGQRLRGGVVAGREAARGRVRSRAARSLPRRWPSPGSRPGWRRERSSRSWRRSPPSRSR